jgi:hypothetical protein
MVVNINEENIMSDLLMSQTGLWTAITLGFIFVVMAWFLYKMVKLSGQKKKG